MAGDNKCGPRGWTLETLYIYFAAAIEALEKTGDERETRNKERLEAARETIDVAKAAADKAIVKAETATEKRFDSVNEFRAALADQTANFMPRTEYNIAHSAIVEKIDSSLVRVAALETQKDTSAKSSDRYMSTIFSVLALAISAIGVIIIVLKH